MARELVKQKARFAPSRGRELKFIQHTHVYAPNAFAPSRGRELKFQSRALAVALDVRPLTGAGIEINIAVTVDKI